MKAIVSLLTLLVVWDFGQLRAWADYHYESEESDWVDPGDMISFDPVLKKNKKSMKVKDSNEQWVLVRYWHL